MRATASRPTKDGAMFVTRPESAAELTKTKLKAENLNIYYGAFQAIRGATLAMPENRVTALIGPSGCGKSTFIRALNRMHDLTPGARVEGHVLLDGRDIYAPDVDPVTIRHRVGMVFQRPNPFPKSIFENVVYGPRVQGERRTGVLARHLRAKPAPCGAMGRGEGSARPVRRSIFPAASSSGSASRAASRSTPK